MVNRKKRCPLFGTAYPWTISDCEGILDKKTNIKKSRQLYWKIKIELDISNYVTKSDEEKAINDDAIHFDKKADLWWINAGKFCD